MAKSISGKYAIVAILSLALAAVGGGTWYRVRLQQRPARLWGREAVQLILNGTKVTALRLEPVGEAREKPPREIVGTGGLKLAVVEQTGDLSEVPDLLYIRRALVHDNSFDWADPLGDRQPKWEYALRFTDGENDTTVLFAPNCTRAKLLETGEDASMKFVMPGIEKFLKDQFNAKPNVQL